MAKNTFGTRLRQLREEAGLSRIAFAKTVGASPASVWNWESGAAEPRGNAISAISKTLKVSEAFLLSGSGATEKPRPMQNSHSESPSATIAQILADARAQIAQATGFKKGEIALKLELSAS